MLGVGVVGGIRVSWLILGLELGFHEIRFGMRYKDMVIELG